MQSKVGSTNLSLVRVKREVSMSEETMMAQVLLLMQQQMDAQHRMMDDASAATGPAGRDCCGGSATRSETAKDENTC